MIRPLRSLSLALVAVLFFPAAALFAQGAAWTREHYTKHEFKIPMRDGKRLHTAVYVPKDESKRYPILLLRTPYSVSPYGIDRYRDSLGPSEQYARQGFIFAYQDVRGCYMSEGEFENMRPQIAGKKGPNDVDESSDTYDTIDWLVKNVSPNNGRVGTWGISYPGFYASCSAIDAHPALKAVSPQAPIADWYVGDDFHHNGALYLPHFFNFISGFGRPRPEPTTDRSDRFKHGTPDGYRFFLGVGPLAKANEKWFDGEVAFWDDVVKHPDYDEFWKARNLRPHLANVKPAVLTVGGWFDAEDLFGALETYRSIERQSPGAENRLVMGPWSHGGWNRSDGDSLGHVTFASKTGERYRNEIEYPFFRYHLWEEGDLDLPEASIFETGTNTWRRYDSWPPANAARRALYFHPGGKLAWEPPAGNGSGGPAFEEYPSDPRKPVPFTDEIAIGMTREHMVGDQRFAGTRPDVLVFETPVLEKDVTISGPILPTLFVSTSGTDSDFVVKLIDVYPNDYPDPEPNPERVKMGGYQQLVRGEAFRGKYRNGFDAPAPFTPGEPAKIEYPMPDAAHCFRTGHKIMVQIQSSWFPLVDRNPQKFMNIYEATEADMTKATQRLYHTPEMPSRVTLTLLE